MVTGLKRHKGQFTLDQDHLLRRVFDSWEIKLTRSFSSEIESLRVSELVSKFR